VAISDVFLTHPLPVLGQPEPIFPDDGTARSFRGHRGG
jgi:hypothetical protein